jgi:hypothetical protein
VREVQLLRADTAVALGALENVLTALICHYPSFDSCHMKLVSRLEEATWHPSPEGSARELSQSG